MLSQQGRVRIKLVAAIAALIGMCAANAYAQSNAYKWDENYGKTPGGKGYIMLAALGVDSKGNIWGGRRCQNNIDSLPKKIGLQGNGTCENSTEPTIVELDKTGHPMKSFGEGMFVTIHGLYVDRDGNVWGTDAMAKGGKGSQVIKFSPEGKVLMTFGQKGVRGEGPYTLNEPSDVIQAPNGDIFISDGHGADSNHRIVKYTKDGKFIMAWGEKGTGPGKFLQLHALAMDSQGRLFVGDRQAGVIQIFTQDGKYLDTWTQFGAPAGIFIDAHDTIYVSSGMSAELPPHPEGMDWGIRIGSAKDGKVMAFIPTVGPEPQVVTDVVADPEGNVYAAQNGRNMSENGYIVRKYVKK